MGVLSRLARIRWSQIIDPPDPNTSVTSISASVITSGTIATARLGSGTANSSTFLRGDQTWAPAGGSGASATTIEVDLGTPKYEGRFTITDAGISPTSKIMCWQAPGPYTGKGTRADEAAMQQVEVIAVEPASGTATVYWQTPQMIASRQEPSESPVRDGQTAAAFPQMTKLIPTPDIPTRLGRIRGNVKFSYVIFA